MPTYDYECRGCGKTFEYFQNMSDDPLTQCPECGKPVKRLIGGGMGIIFKGNGFYVTDNKKPSPASSTESKGPKETKGTADKKPSETAKTT